MRTHFNSPIGQTLSHKPGCKGRLSFARLEIIRVITVIALSFGMVLPADSGERIETPDTRLPVLHDARPKFALFSWRRPDGARRFELISNRDGNQEDRFIDKFSIQHTKGVSLRALEHELTRLPKRCLVTWIRDAPHRLDYAETHVVSSLKRLAATLHVDLQFNEMNYESTAVER